MGFELTRFCGKIDEEFICSICCMVLETPVQTTCEHTFCSECINQWIQIKTDCPVCRHDVTLPVRPIARYFRGMLDRLEIKCDFALRGCQSILKLDNLKEHVTNHCNFNPSTEIICDKGCNLSIRRHDYEANNCLSHLSNALKKLNDKLDEQLKIINSLRWQICHKMDIAVNEPNILEFGQSNSELDLALVQSIRPLTPDNPSFKIEILERGESHVITIGLTCKGFPIGVQPGWIDGSIGYHGDDGKIFNGRGIGEEFGPKWENGDIIECEVKTREQLYTIFGKVTDVVVVFFSRNGQSVGHRVVKMPQFGLFPTCSIRSKGGKVKYFDS